MNIDHPGKAAACAAATLATAWAPVAHADILTRVEVEANLTAPIGDGVIMFGGLGSGGQAFVGATLRDVQVGGLTILTQLYSEMSVENFAPSYALLGVSWGSGSSGTDKHLVLSVPHLTYIGLSFEDAFPGFSEQEIIQSIATGDDTLALNFLRTNFAVLLQGTGNSGRALGFSLGSDFGTLTVRAVAVPAPMAAALAALGSVAALRRRRG